MLHVILDATGVYHEQATQALAEAGVTLSIINPAHVKAFGQSLAVRTKPALSVVEGTDGVDSVVLARYGALLKPPAWTATCSGSAAVAGSAGTPEAIAQDLQRERNRQENANATDTPEQIRESLADSIAFLLKPFTPLQRDIDDPIVGQPGLKNDLALLKSSPGVGPQGRSNLLALLHVHAFGSAQQLAA